MIKDTTAANEAVTPNNLGKAFFDALTLNGYKMYFRDQLRSKEIWQSIEDMLACGERVKID